MFSPTGMVYLIGGVELDNSYQNTFDFSNAIEQRNYFIGKAVSTLTEYTFIRKDKTIRVNANYESLWGVNYVVYQNTNGKWIYNFTTDKKYINEGLTEIVLETDVLQTYLFDYQFNPSFIEREHQNRWSSVGNPILNYEEENLHYGDEYIQSYDKEVLSTNIKWYLAVASSPLEDLNAGASSYNTQNPQPIQTTPTPLHYYLIPYVRNTQVIYNIGGDSILDAQRFGLLLSSAPQVMSVSYIPYLPFNIMDDTNNLACYNGEFESLPIDSSISSAFTSFKILKLVGDNLNDTKNRKILSNHFLYENVNMPSSFGVGLPRDYNKESKLLTYPYMFLQLNDYKSEPLTIKNEYVGQNTIDVWVTQALSHNPKTKYYIGLYKGENDGKSNAIINNTVNDLPLTNDYYKNYMIQHKASATTGMALSLASSAVGIGVGVATGGLGLAFTAGSVMSGFSAITQEMSKRKDLSNIPNSIRHAGNNIHFDIVDDNINVRLRRYEITEQYKKILGDYFAMYGYKCNELKTPNLKSRYYYNFIKTINANITGDIDSLDLQKIKQAFNNGVTIWHYHSNSFKPLDYSYDNVEVNLI